MIRTYTNLIVYKNQRPFFAVFLADLAESIPCPIDAAGFFIVEYRFNSMLRTKSRIHIIFLFSTYR